MQPILTIAIPTYNRKELLMHTLDSISNQVTDEIEVLVSDNASTDGTEIFVKDKYPFVTYFKNNDNIGADRNFLECYKKASGKYVWLVGSDDIVEEQAIKELIAFLTANNPTLVFLNHSTFKNEPTARGKTFLNKTAGSIITQDKEIFITYSKWQLTYMSSFVLSKQSFNNVKNPYKYVGTSFIHTCIAYEAAKDGNAKLGIFFTPCIMQNVTPANTGLSINPKRHFEVFGINERKIFENIAPLYGFSKKLLLKYHEEFLSTSWPIMILSFKYKKITTWREDFWNVGYPVIKDYKDAKIRVLAAVYIPTIVIILVKKLKDFIKQRHYE